ncbi:MAG: arylesterase [Pseudomonadota bacterium]|nr:arylesterase [Pseudomonadota bacterium]
MVRWSSWCWLLLIGLLALPTQAVAALATNRAATSRPVLVLGDSLSAAYNIPRTQGWVHLLGARLAEMRPPREVINASISGATTADGLARLPQLLARDKPALVIIELGANDGLRGLPLIEIERNLQRMIVRSREAGAKVLLLGIELPVNYGPRYRAGLQAIYARLARRYRLPRVPFLLAKVALQPALMQDDGLHPRAAGEPLVLDTVWPALQPMLSGLPR